MKLTRADDGSYYADTASGRVEIRPDHSETGHVRSWIMSQDDGRKLLGNRRTLREIRQELAI